MKKKILSIFLAFCLIFSLLPMGAMADEAKSGTCGENLTWTLDGDGTLTISGTGKMYDYDYSDYEAAAPWIRDKYKIKSVVIEDGVTSIGSEAFFTTDGYPNITKVTIPSSVESIGGRAFANCTALTEVTIPNGVKSIGGSAFLCCEKLVSITLPDSVEKLDDHAFYACDKLTSVALSRSMTEIGERTFAYCYDLQRVSIPKNVTKIYHNAFSHCDKLAEIAYGGTKEAWETTGYEMPRNQTVKLHYNCDSFDGHYVPIKVVKPTCVQSGRIEYLCPCGYEYTEYVPPRGHDYTVVKTIASTCSEHGYDLLKCKVCGDEKKDYKDDELKAHTYVDKVVEPTCLTGGYTLHKCSVCGDEYMDNLTALLGHSMVEVGEKPATCNEAGHTAGVQCSRCGLVESGVTEIPALGHSYGAWTQTKEPTCTAKGTEVRTCTRCNATETRDVEALGHNTTHHAAKAATCTEIGWEAYDTCSRCDYTTYKEIPATGHHHDAVVTAPTCTEKGYTTHTCACGDSYVDSYTDALGHSYGAWAQTKAPTCTAKGTETRTCTRCNATETRDVEALGHSYGAWTQTKAPTCTAKGTETKTCTRCNASETRDVAALGHSYKNGKCTRCGAADPNYIAAPALSITTSAGKPKIYWNAVDGAVKYWVYRSTDGKTFNYYDSTTKTSYTNNSTSIGTTYYYKVKAVNSNNAASDYSVSKGILCKPAAPSVSINRSNGKPKLSWKAVSGATKYWIYRSTDGVNFKYFDSTTKTSYTNSGAASGTKYYYRVKAVAVVNGKNVTSANSSTKSLFTSLAKPSVSITTSNGKPKLTWKAVTGADKYYVYRSTDGKNFSYWDSTTKTSYVNSGAKKNTKYYYKVKAVCASNSNANSAQSAAVSIKATK